MASNVRAAIVPSATINKQVTALFDVVVDVPVEVGVDAIWNVAPPSPPAPVSLTLQRTSVTTATAGWNYLGPPTLDATVDGFVVVVQQRVSAVSAWTTVSTTTVSIATALSQHPSGNTYGANITSVPESEDTQVLVRTLRAGSPSSESPVVASPLLGALDAPYIRQESTLTRVYASTDGSAENVIALSSAPVPGSLIVVLWTCKRSSTQAPTTPVPNPGTAIGKYLIASRNPGRTALPPRTINRVYQTPPIPAAPKAYGVPSFNGPFDLSQAQSFVATNSITPPNYLECGVFVAPVLDAPTLAARAAQSPTIDNTYVTSITLSDPRYDGVGYGSIKAYEIVLPDLATNPGVKGALSNVEPASRVLRTAGLDVAPGRVYAGVLAVNGDNPAAGYQTVGVVESPTGFAEDFQDNVATALYGDMLTYFGIYIRDPGAGSDATASLTVTYPDAARTGLTQAVVL